MILLKYLYYQFICNEDFWDKVIEKYPLVDG